MPSKPASTNGWTKLGGDTTAPTGWPAHLEPGANTASVRFDEVAMSVS